MPKSTTSDDMDSTMHDDTSSTHSADNLTQGTTTPASPVQPQQKTETKTQKQSSGGVASSHKPRKPSPLTSTASTQLSTKSTKGPNLAMFNANGKRLLSSNTDLPSSVGTMPFNSKSASVPESIRRAQAVLQQRIAESGWSAKFKAQEQQQEEEEEPQGEEEPEPSQGESFVENMQLVDDEKAPLDEPQQSIWESAPEHETVDDVAETVPGAAWLSAKAVSEMAKSLESIIDKDKMLTNRYGDPMRWREQTS